MPRKTEKPKGHNMALDKIALIFKVGDQAGAEGLKHGDPVCYISESEWGKSLNEILSENMFRVFAVVQVDPRILTDVIAALIQVNDPLDTTKFRPRAKRIDYTKLAIKTGILDLELKLLSNEVVPLLNGFTLVKEDFIDASTLPNVTSIKDNNSVSSGSYTVGSGGDYATLAAALADVGSPLTGTLTFTVISATTETASSTSNSALDGNEFNITSNSEHYGNFGSGNLISLNAGAGITWYRFINTSTSAVNINLTKLNLKQVAATSSNSGMIQADVGANVTININNTLINCNTQSICAVRCDGAGGVRKIFNCIFVGGQGSNVSAIQLIASNTNDIYENCTVYNNTRGIWNYSNIAFAAKNIASFSNILIDYAYGLAPDSGLGNAVASKCASSDASGSEVSLRGLVAANEFESTDITQSTFLKVKSNATQLDDAGIAVGIVSNTYGIRGNARPHGALYSIGADELAIAGGTSFAAMAHIIYDWMGN